MEKKTQNSRESNLHDGAFRFQASQNPAKDQSNQIGIPSISLPKGGGAIKGIEEKFQVNAATGTSSFGIPIPLSPSRLGFVPPIGLSYNSGSGNSPFGLGWQLAIPSIVRKTEKKLPEYKDEEESDTFILSGAEDMVPLLEKQEDGSWKKYEQPRTEDGINYKIKRYRPRVEGLFARIEKWKNAATGETHWRTITKDNIHSYYGLSDESRVRHPADEKKVFEWMLCRTHDDKGNITIYNYKKEDFAGISKKLNEKNKIGNCTQLYLKQVWYGNKKPYYLGDASPGTDDFMFSVVFDYGEHDTSENIPKDIDKEKNSWTCRKDPFSTYRSGFEIRTYRRCNRALIFHCFDMDELPHSPYLTKSVQLFYDEDLKFTSNTATVGGFSFLVKARQNGHLWDASSNSYKTKFLPEIEINYQQHEWNTEIKSVTPENRIHSPVGLGDKSYLWIDLFSEGIAGILTEKTGGWFYKSNLGNGNFSNAKPVAPKPSFNGISSGKLSIQELEGDGIKCLVQFEGEPKGFFKLTDEEEWEPMKNFESFPNINPLDPNMRSMDLNGDGLVDLLFTEDDKFRWFPGAGEKGFEISQSVTKEIDEEKGPAIVFADQEQCIFLTDMSGDGLTDIVRIRNGNICYWPNLGYGHFGAKVNMDNAPLFDHPDAFNPRLLRLADIDGSGTTDVIYLGKNDFRVWMNCNGNEWTAGPQIISAFPQQDNLSDVSVLDFLGSGTACIVYSSSIDNQPLQYIDLMGSKKPNLFIGYQNNYGKEVSIEYKSSTFFYLEDKKQGTPWVTKLPFPVHCISNVRTEDKIRETVFTGSYKYRHGYFDHEEREFRGFARVEQLDTEDFAQFKINDAKNVVQEDLHQPPVKTISWFHAGAMLRNKKIIHQCEEEYFKNTGFNEYDIPEPLFPEGLSADELREAYRACKGTPLRIEVYAEDNSDKSSYPYTASQSTIDVRLVQPRGENKHASFLVVPSESVSYAYDRSPADPRISQSFVLDTDELGNVKKSCSVIYPRRARPLGINNIPDKVWSEQSKMHITYEEAFYTDDIVESDVYRLRSGYESKSYQVDGALQPLDFFFKKENLKADINAASEILFEEEFDGALKKRLSAHSRGYFYKDDLSGALPLGELSKLGIPYKSYQLAFTKDLVTKYYGDKVTDQMLTDAKYVHSEGDVHWWAQPGEPIFPPAPKDNFYMPIGGRDVFGNESFVEYDSYFFLPITTTDAIGNTATAKNDYRTLAPVLLTDANLNRAAIETDALGMVINSALMGKEGSSEGDTLADPTVKMEYDFFNWKNNGKPNYVHTYAREQHGPTNPRWQESYVYSDGGGGVIMTKAQAEPGKAKRWNVATKQVEEVDANPRWLGNGRTIVNNKGNVVKQYDPYFSTTFEYESEDALVETGMSSVLYYDAIGRNVQTAFPNGTFVKVEFDAWHSKTFDAHDTVKDSQWYIDRGSPDPLGAEPIHPETRAAWLAAKHYDTPGITYSDSLGKATYAVTDYGNGKTTSSFLETDAVDRFSKMYDALGRNVAEGYVNLLGVSTYGKTAEKGERWILTDVMGRCARLWDNNIREMYCTYDKLHRTVSMFVKQGVTEILFSHIVYGDLYPDALARAKNMKGQAYQIYDQAGVITIKSIDFKGNGIAGERRLAKEYKQNINWSVLNGLTNIDAIHIAVEPFLESEVFTSSVLLDALNRPVTATLPDQSIVQPQYNEANLLDSLEIKIGGVGDFVTFLDSQDYDEKGQRQFAKYGNGSITKYFYDPQTFRLVNLVTKLADADGDGRSIQNLKYIFDAVGNVVQQRDDAQQTHFFKNAVVYPESKFEYDAVYQLKRATGREHAGLGGNTQRNDLDLPCIQQLPHQNDATAVRNYTEQYEYDDCGNIKRLQHLAAGANWTQRYKYEYEDDINNKTNRLKATSLPGDADGFFSAIYKHDTQGNITSMPHLAALDSLRWDFMDQLKEVNLGGGGTAYYVYGLGGKRMRKIIERPSGKKLERIYLGSVELFRERQNNAAPDLERYTLNVSDNTGRIAQVDTKTIDENNSDGFNRLHENVIRYQYNNHLGSAMLETNGDGHVLSYEEYHPYGTSAYRVSKPDSDISLKRYRFSGKERDDETGFHYFGARYYAAWLGRWTNSDPAGFVDGLNLFGYCRNNPITLSDPSGTQSRHPYEYPELNQAMASNPQSFQPTGEVASSGSGNRLRWRVLQHETFGRVWQYVGAATPENEILVWGGPPLIRESDALARWPGGRVGMPPPETADASGGNTSPPAPEEPDPERDEVEGTGGTEGSEEGSDGENGEGVSSEAPGGINSPINPGSAAVSTYDSVMRGRYTSANSSASRTAREAIRSARASRDAVRAWETAREVSEARNLRRIQTQGRLSPGGRAMSVAIDEGRSFSSSVTEYMERAPGSRAPSPTRDAITIADRVAEGAGRSNRLMTRISRFGRYAGPIGIAVGVGIGAYNIYNAPEGQLGRTIGQEIGNFAGGALGFSLGMSAGVALAGGISGVLIGLGLISGPIGWLAIGIGLGVAVLGAWAFGNVFSSIGGEIGALFD